MEIIESDTGNEVEILDATEAEAIRTRIANAIMKTYKDLVPETPPPLLVGNPSEFSRYGVDDVLKVAEEIEREIDI
ncbi:hypothetical protein GF354_06160 [Candidatus Peregrinibacteria bacterium]|nr:hypothetical protein [Candidatus Peregrinibacteria bacterium]